MAQNLRNILRLCPKLHSEPSFLATLPLSRHTPHPCSSLPHPPHRTSATSSTHRPSPLDDVASAVRRAATLHYAPSDAASVVRHAATLQHSLDDLIAIVSETGSAGDSTDRTAELAQFFSSFDGESILLQTGVVQPAAPAASAALARLSSSLRASPTPFSLQQATNCLSTMTLLGQIDVPLSAALVSGALPEIATAPPATVASLCYSLGLAGYSDLALLKELEELLAARHQEFPVQDLAKVVWMFGRAQYTSEAVADIVQALAKRVLAPSATAQDLVYGLWACGIHDTYDTELTERLLQVVPPRLRDLSGSELAKLAHGLQEEGVTAATEGELFGAIEGRAVELAGGMFPRDLAKLIGALGSQPVGKAFLKAVEPAVMARLELFTFNELNMMIQAYNQWGVHDETCVAIARQMHLSNKN